MFRWRIRQGCSAKKRRRQFMAMSILWARWFPWIDWSVESFWCWVRIFVFYDNINLIPKKSPSKSSKKSKKVSKSPTKVKKNCLKNCPKIPGNDHFVDKMSSLNWRKCGTILMQGKNACFYDNTTKSTQKLSKKAEIVQK